MTAISFDHYEKLWLKEIKCTVVNVEKDNCPLKECPLCVASVPNESSSGTRLFEANGYLLHVNNGDTNGVNTFATVPLCILSEVRLRFLCPDDLEEVRALCQDWFPIGEQISIIK
jgi:hypothetical protein